MHNIRTVSALTTLGLLALLFGSAVLFASPAGNQHEGRLTHQTFKWSRLQESTSKQSFRRLRHLGAGVTNQGLTTVTLSGMIRGGPVDVRIISIGPTGEENGVLKPGFARIRGKGFRSFSHVFGRQEGSGTCRNYVVEWRSPSGRKITFERGSLLVDHRRPTDAVCP